jgi:hypothetical protein
MKLRCEQHFNAKFELNLDFIGLNSNTLNVIWIQLRSIPIQIWLKINGMQINGWCFQNLLVNMVLEKQTSKLHKSKKTPFHASSLGNEGKKF